MSLGEGGDFFLNFLCNFILQYLWTGQVMHNFEAEKTIGNIAQEN